MWIPVRVLRCPSLSCSHSLHGFIIISCGLSSSSVSHTCSLSYLVISQCILSCALCEFFGFDCVFLPVSLCLSACLMLCFIFFLVQSVSVFSLLFVFILWASFILNFLFFLWFLYFLDFLVLTLFRVPCSRQFSDFWFALRFGFTVHDPCSGHWLFSCHYNKFTLFPASPWLHLDPFPTLLPGSSQDCNAMQ